MRISRRSLLRAFALGSLSPALLRSLPAGAASRPGDIAVIGAGIAGLAAARDLSQRGFSVTVLEARDRLGGRLWTDRSLGVPLDLGASWIHGTRRNPIARLARDLSQPVFDWDYDDAELVDLTGTLGSLTDRLDAFEDALSDMAARSASRKDGWSVADAVSALQKDSRFADLSELGIGAAITYLVEQEYAADSGDLALTALYEGSAFGGSDAILPEGYDRLAVGLAQGLDIRLSTPVTGLAYSEKGVSIRFGTGSIDVDCALVTVPLGVLKKDTIAFDPALPDRKARAIRRLDMGVLNKVYLTLEAPVPNLNVLNLIRLSGQPRAFPYWINLEPATGTPVLGVLNTGSFARDLEKLDNMARIDAAHEALKSMFGAALPGLNGGISTAWSADPHAFGSYSYLPVGADVSDRTALAAPVADRLFFAGEATSSDYPATVHGAYLSGLDAARAIVAALP